MNFNWLESAQVGNKNKATDDIVELLNFILNQTDKTVQCIVVRLSPDEFCYAVWSEELLWLMANQTVNSSEGVVGFSHSTIHLDDTYDIVKAYVSPVSFKIVSFTNSRGSPTNYFGRECRWNLISVYSTAWQRTFTLRLPTRVWHIRSRRW